MFRRVFAGTVLPVVIAVGSVATGCTLPSATPVDRVIAVSDTCNVEVRVGGDADGSFLAARNSGLCEDFDDVPEKVGGLRLETTEGVSWCYVSEWPACSTYTEGLPGQPLVEWKQVIAYGSLVNATVLLVARGGEFVDLDVWP